MFLIFLFIGSCKNALNEKIPIEHFFNKTDKSNFQLSPNGKFVSYLQRFEGIRNLYVIDLETKKTKRITSEREKGIRYSFWANNEELIFLKERSGDDSLRLMAVNRESLNSRFVLPPLKGKLRWIGPLKVNENNELLVGLNKRDSSVFDAYRLNILNRELKLVTTNPGNIVEWIPDNSGIIRAAVASDGNVESILYRHNEHSPFQTVLSNNFRTSVEPLGFSNENENRLFVLSNMNRDKKALLELNMLTGEEVNTLFSHVQVDLTKGGYSIQNGRMDFIVYNLWKPEVKFFNRFLEEVYECIQNKLPGYVIDIEGVPGDYSALLLHAYTDVDPGAYYYYNVEQDKLLEIGKVNTLLEVESLSPTTTFQYQTSDGLSIDGYLTIPKDAPKGPLPLIVLPHNAPSSRVVWGYNAEVQFLASRGYVVFQPNFRGSTGYGKEFWTAGFKSWGTKVQQDIKEGVEWLVNQGIADAKRIGIYGYSFGGYSALYGACFNSETYACAASYSGIINLYTYLKEFPPYFTPYVQKFYEMVGDPSIDGDYLRAYSPVFNADKVKIPLLVAQGIRDNRNNASETNHFIKELKKNGVEVNYLLKDEGGYFTDEQNLVSFYEELELFFQKHLLKR